MKKLIGMLCAPLLAILLLTGCHNAALSSQNSPALPDTILDWYYAGQKDPAFAYFQHASIQKFLAMWVEEETKDILTPQWNLDRFTQIRILDHDLVEIAPDEAVYCCTFSNGAERFGYVILKYDETGPSVSNWGVTETTPYSYDLKANWEEIRTGLIKTDLDLSTATASRVSLLDKEKKRADQAILFTDGKGAHYVCYLGDSPIEVKTWQTH